MANYTTFSSKKNSLTYKHGEFYYFKNRTSEKVQYLRCTHFERGCKGTAKLVLEEDRIATIKAHNHEPEDYDECPYCKQRITADIEIFQ